MSMLSSHISKILENKFLGGKIKVLIYNTRSPWHSSGALFFCIYDGLPVFLRDEITGIYNADPIYTFEGGKEKQEK